MKKNTLKIILDVIMLMLLLLMYNKMAINLTFHEVGGLAVCGLFLIHKTLNWDWITGVSKKIFKKTLPGRTRFCYIVDVLLLVSMAFIAISGIMISETILTGISSRSMIWKQGHYFAAALAIVLTGVHIGLHWSFIKSIFARVIRLPRAAAKPLGILVVAAVLVYGGYSLATSSFTRWISGPFSMLGADAGGIPERPDGTEFSGELLERLDMPEQTEDMDEIRTRPEGDFESGSINTTGVMEVVAVYGSIAAVFAFLTAWIETFLKKNRSERNLSANLSG